MDIIVLRKSCMLKGIWVGGEKSYKLLLSLTMKTSNPMSTGTKVSPEGERSLGGKINYSNRCDRC